MHGMADAVLLWKREVVQLVRRPARLVGLLMRPLMWLILFGFGVRAIVDDFSVNGHPVNYLHFLAAGIMGMTMIFGASRGGMSILRDREQGFLKEVLVAPVSRSSILVGVGLGFTTRAVIQGLLLLAVAVLLGVRLGDTPAEWAWRLGATTLLLYTLGLAMVLVGISIAWRMDDIMAFSTSSNFIVLPLFLLSGAIVSVDRLPTWLAAAHYANPLTYGVDALRQVMLGSEFGHFPMIVDVAVLAGMLLGALALGIYAMNRASEGG